MTIFISSARINAYCKKFACGAFVTITMLGCTQQDAPELHNNNQQATTDVAQNQLRFTKADYLTRNIEDEIFYFVMPDRFHNANSANDNGDPSRPISYGGLDKTSKWAFHGGDIAGIKAKLDYIENLGVTAIWMTPILRNRAVQSDGFAHHGYWVVDFTEIDPHFGSNDDLKSLIEQAHKRDIKVFFDIITNHTADVIKYKECHRPTGEFLIPEQKGCKFLDTSALANGETYTPFVLPSEKSVKVPAWLNDPQYYNNQGDSTWEGESVIKGDFVGLDDLDTSHPRVISGLTQVFKDLISDFRPDGFRIDTVKHVDIEFWQSFGPAITAHARSIGLPEFFIFGEVYDGNPAVLSKFTTLGKLPSVLDFNFAFTATNVIFNNHSVNQLNELFNNDDYYRDGDSSPLELLNFLGNHDMGRTGYFIDKYLVHSSAKEKLNRSELAHAFMYLSRGIPVLYYGDEQGFTGDGGDVDSRENMDPSLVESYNDNALIGSKDTTAMSNFNRQHPLYKSIAHLASMRLKHTSLRQGEHINRILDEEKRVYGFSRVFTQDMIDYLAVFNFSDQTQRIDKDVGTLQYDVLAGNMSNSVNQKDEKIEMMLAPQSYILLRSTTPIVKSMVDDISMGKPYEENERVFLPFDLSFTNESQLNLAQITVYQLGQDGQKTRIAFDTTRPYTAVLLPSQLQSIQKIEVEADNFSGQTTSKVFDLSIY